MLPNRREFLKIKPGEGGAMLRMNAAGENLVSLAVPYRGYWFYVRDDGLSTTLTLDLLMALTRLRFNSGGAQNVPVLTLPVTC